jgi:hypothetical protein
MNNYDLIYEIDNMLDGVFFDKIEGFSILGEMRSGADVHPIKYYAYSTIPLGDYDRFEGEGWTPSEALRDLHKQLKEAKENPYIEDEEEHVTTT